MSEKNFEEQAKTLEATKEMLALTHKAVIIRPTGFGKTWLMTELIKDYRNVLYLYPSAVVRDTVVNRYYDSMFDENTNDYIDENGNVIDPETVDTCIELNKIDKCELMTYSKLIRLTNSDFNAMKYDLVLCDECHRIGGPKTKVAMEKLFKKLGKTADFVGATATPTRMDNFDVVSHFYADNMVYTYTLLNAINDGLVQKPNYCYATYDIETDLKDAALTAGESLADPIVEEVIQSKLIELSKIYNMPSIIREICDKYAADTSYMKFIVFFANKKHMASKIDDVVDWFRQAYPDHSVSTLKISSCNYEESMNISKLESLIPREKHIDLIACIDMLNMGYHVNDQTGIFMYRGTRSNTIFTQQLGRALSVGANNSAIVFDIVDNLHRKAMFEIKSGHKRRSKSSSHHRSLTHYRLSDENRETLVFESADGEIVESQYHLDGNNNVVDENDMPSTLYYDCDTGKVYNLGSPDDPRKNINEITADCLNAVGHEATYRELMAKIMAEPLTQRCKRAFELHFRTWCYHHGVKYPVTNEELKTIYSLDKKDFYEEFLGMIKTNKLAYPLDDAEALLTIGEHDDDVPLRICAKARNVSVAQVLDMLGLQA